MWIIIGGALIAPLLILFVALLSVFKGEPEGVTSSPSPVARPIFAIDQILGIDQVIASVRDGVPADFVPTIGEIHAAILPHHTITGTQLMEFWTDLAADAHPSVIVVVGPNHENDGTGLVQTTHGVWTTPFGSVETDDALVDELISDGAATDESDPFVNEHAIGTHVSYIAKLFPGVPMVPVIAKSPTGELEARAFVNELKAILPKDALVVMSIDFCHYLPEDRTDAMDAETLAWINARDYAHLERQHSDHFDSPFALIAYLIWNDERGDKAELVWHTTSHRLLGDVNAPGTSYFVYFSKSTPPPPLPEADDASVTLDAVGDIMLGRGVETALANTNVSTAFAPAQAELADADLRFANLESILSSTSLDSTKELHFKGDPARVDALQFLGLSDVSVANNHSNDYGESAWQESVGHLTDAGIGAAGGYRNDGAPVIEQAPGGHRVVFLAYDDVDRALIDTSMMSQIQAAKKLGDLVVVSFHWGIEYQHFHTQRQADLAHEAIDAGADLVIGSHPHVLQGIETYNGGLILYSIGNFVFDQSGEDQNETVVAKVTWQGTERTLELDPMRIDGDFPRAASADERASTLARMAGWSDASLANAITSGSLDW